MSSKKSNIIKSQVGVGFKRRNPHIQSSIANNNFPYRDEYEDFNYSDEELELADEIKHKYKSPDAALNPFDLRDRGTAPDISKVTEIAKGISPFPSMYKKRDGHLGKSAENISNTHSHGFYMGSNFSGHTYDKAISDNEDEADLPVYNLEDLAKKQLKEYIRTVLMEVL
jgi:hypothetical protein